MGAFYRRKRYHLGKAKAITATAHKLARIIYSLLSNGAAFEPSTEDDYEKKYQHRIQKNLKLKAKKMGFVLTNIETGEVLL